MHWFAVLSARFAATRTLVRTPAILPLLLLLLAGQFLGAVHHHASDESSTACPMCVVSHAPAMRAAGLPVLAAPVLAAERAVVAPQLAPRDRSPIVACGRAPPRA